MCVYISNVTCYMYIRSIAYRPLLIASLLVKGQGPPAEGPPPPPWGGPPCATAAVGPGGRGGWVEGRGEGGTREVMKPLGQSFHEVINCYSAQEGTIARAIELTMYGLILMVIMNNYIYFRNY